MEALNVIDQWPVTFKAISVPDTFHGLERFLENDVDNFFREVHQRRVFVKLVALL